MKILGRVKIEVIITEKDNKIFFIPQNLDCTYRNSCESCNLIDHCKFLELFTVVNKNLTKEKKFDI